MRAAGRLAGGDGADVPAVTALLAAYWRPLAALLAAALLALWIRVLVHQRDEALEDLARCKARAEVLAGQVAAQNAAVDELTAAAERAAQEGRRARAAAAAVSAQAQRSANALAARISSPAAIPAGVAPCQVALDAVRADLAGR